MKRKTTSAVLVLLAVSLAFAGEPSGPRWYKGNTHTHTWWSDGDSPPELTVGWYREHGYNFLVLSDHNIIAEGEKWADVTKPGRAEAAKAYEEKYPADWVRKRVKKGKTEYRLKTLSEFRPLFEEPGEFLLIPGEEIGDSFEKRSIHVNGLNLMEVVPPQKGKTFRETVQNNIDAVLEQQKKTGRPMLPHLNHPNFGWAFTVEDIVPLRGEKFFEVANGHPGVRNPGDERRPSTERMWDIVLTRRLAELDLPVMYGLATDDAHSIALWGNNRSNPGRGWIMVRAAKLEPEAILDAMNRGDFYASTGVTLESVQFRDGALDVAIKADEGVTYRTQFIGTLQGYDQAATSQPTTNPNEHLSMKYSDTIGRVLAEVEGPHVRYKPTGKEIYVRAKVISSRKKENAVVPGEFEAAWVQPVQP